MRTVFSEKNLPPYKTIRFEAAAHRPKVAVIYTGGTFGMAYDHRTGALVPFNFESLHRHIPELPLLNINVDVFAFEHPIDSSNMHPRTWMELATLIELHYPHYAGFVVIHGTDTMAYTASALSFVAENLSKPIIFTGAQLPLGAVRNDAGQNLVTALEIAGNPATPFKEVCICFDNLLLRANRAKKMESSRFDAFESENFPVLAEVGTGIEYKAIPPAITGQGAFAINGGFDTGVAILRLFPGLNLSTAEAILTIPGNRAVILETYGSGNIPTDPGLEELLSRAHRQGLVLANVSQCAGGRVVPGKYGTGMFLQQLGVASGSDITLEAAVCKMMYLLQRYTRQEDIITEFEKSLRGELTEYI